LKRGEIWTVAGGADYASKPRPAVIVQSDMFDDTPSITICLLTGMPADTTYARFAITPSELNGLEHQSYVMVDKISTIPKSKAGRRIGQLDNEDITKLNRAIILFFGLGDQKS
jgi:mRNA interferase MazF